MNYKILIIEDEKLVRQNIEQLLKEEGYDTIIAANGKEGIEKVKKTNPDLIICDIMMPEINGYKVKEILNKSDKTFDIPLIYLTAKTDTADLRKGMNLGADDYLFKPYKSDDLLRAINKKISKRERIIAKIEGRKKNKEFEEHETLFIGVHKKLSTKINAIVYIKADNQYTTIHLSSGKFYYIRKSLTSWEKVLPATIFKRIHRSQIINLSYIEKLEKNKNGNFKIILKNTNESFPVSRRFAENIKPHIL